LLLFFFFFFFFSSSSSSSFSASSYSVPPFHTVSGPTPGTLCIGSYLAFRPICRVCKTSLAYVLQRSLEAKLARFLVSHENLFSRCTLWGVLVGTVAAVVVTVTASRNYSEEFDLIFLKWTTRNRWSNIGNYCRSHLEQHPIFLFSKDTQRLDGTISYVQASVVSHGPCICTSVDGTYFSQTKLNSQT
jgi:hypothetical protein